MFPSHIMHRKAHICFILHLHVCHYLAPGSIEDLLSGPSPERSCTCLILVDNDIERVTQAKVLGVTLSSDLSWNAHVDMRRVYVSVIRPVLEYACPVWQTSLPMYLSDQGHFFNMATIQENVTLLHSTALAMNAVRM